MPRLRHDVDREGVPVAQMPPHGQLHLRWRRSGSAQHRVHVSGQHDEARAQAMLAAYQAVRPLTAAERQLLPALLRAGALRFWLSRLWDWHLPREASMLKPHDPTHFERVLRHRVAHPEVTGEHDVRVPEPAHRDDGRADRLDRSDRDPLGG